MSIPILLELALAHERITYGEMARRLHISNPRHVVGPIALAGQVTAFTTGKALKYAVW